MPSSDPGSPDAAARRALEIHGLSFSVGALALRCEHLRVPSDAYLCVVGPTGSGKTVFLELLAGLRRPCRGSIRFEGDELLQRPAEGRGIGFAYQDSLLFPFLDVRSNILFAARMRGLGNDRSVVRRCDELMERAGIASIAHRRPRFLSGGERQRASLARAILLRPRILLLDEPLSALDEATRFSMRELLREVHTRERCCVVHVTHDHRDVVDLAQAVATMRGGDLAGAVPNHAEGIETRAHPGIGIAADRSTLSASGRTR